MRVIGFKDPQKSRFEDRYSKYVKNREPKSYILQNKDISSIMKIDESNYNTNKKDYLLK